MSLFLDPNLSDARPELTQAYTEYEPAGISLAFNDVLPFATVEEQKATIPTQKAEDMLRIENMARQPGGHYNRVNLRLGAISYACAGRGLEFPIHLGDGRLFQLPSLAQEEMGARMLRTKTDLWYEDMVAQAIFGADADAGESTAPWATTAASDPLGDLQAASDYMAGLTGMRPNVLYLGEKAYMQMCASDSIKAYMPGAPAIATQTVAEFIKREIGVSKIAISSARKNTADEGLDLDAAPIVPADKVALTYSAAGDGSPYVDAACGRIFIWAEDGGEPYVVEQYFSDETRSIILRVRMNVDVNVWNPSLVRVIDITKTKGS